MDKEYKLSAKRADTGKWWTYGSIKKNQYGNMQAGFKVTPELKELITANEGKWINFSLFEVEEKKEQIPHNEAKANAYQPSAGALLSDEIPFSPHYWF